MQLSRKFLIVWVIIFSAFAAIVYLFTQPLILVVLMAISGMVAAIITPGIILPKGEN